MTANATTRTVLCCLAILPAAVWAAVRLPGVERGPLVQLMAFTPYVAAWSLVPLVLMLSLRRWWLAGVACLVVAAMAWAVLPRAFGSAETAGAGAVTLRVLTSNMQFGAADAEAMVGLVRDRKVDVLALQEYTPEAEAALLAAGLDRELPYRESHALPKASGSALYSRYPLTEGGVRTNPGQFVQAYATVSVPGGQPVLVESVHTTPPARLDNLNYWRRDLEHQSGATESPAGISRILAGDFNSTLDHAPLRDLIARGYRDAAEAAGAGFVGTWGPYEGRHGDSKPIPPVTIDHVLADQRLGVGKVSAHSVTKTDHRALLVELFVPGR